VILSIRNSAGSIYAPPSKIPLFTKVSQPEIIAEMRQILYHYRSQGESMIIGICGLIGSGKGTVADMLVDQHGFEKLSFADSLKDAVAAVFGWPRHLLEGDTDESRSWREQKDHWWADRLDMPNLTPRWVLQWWGTEVCRRGFHDDIWVASIESKLRDRTKNYVIPDTRFPNEIDMIARSGGTVWWVRRGDDPEWFQQYKLNDITPQGIHPSEWAWARSQFNLIIDNNDSIETLRTKVDDAVTSVK